MHLSAISAVNANAHNPTLHTSISTSILPADLEGKAVIRRVGHVAPASERADSADREIVRHSQQRQSLQTLYLQFACSLLTRPALIVVAETLTILSTNKLFDALTEFSLPIQIRNNQLKFHTPLHRQAIISQLQIANSIGPVVASLAFPGESGAPAVVLTARHISIPQLTPIDPHITTYKSALIEFWGISYIPDLVTFNALSQEIRLSPAERHDLMRIAMGYCIAEMAVQDNVAQSTVRQRVKAILSKAHCSRQQDLICLVRSLCPSRVTPG